MVRTARIFGVFSGMFARVFVRTRNKIFCSVRRSFWSSFWSKVCGRFAGRSKSTCFAIGLPVNNGGNVRKKTGLDSLFKDFLLVAGKPRPKVNMGKSHVQKTIFLPQGESVQPCCIRVVVRQYVL